mgnify:CR=1 FL=1
MDTGHGLVSFVDGEIAVYIEAAFFQILCASPPDASTLTERFQSFSVQ